MASSRRLRPPPVASGRASAEVSTTFRSGIGSTSPTGSPGAATQDHPSRHALVGQQLEADALSLDSELVTTRPAAAFRCVRQIQFELGAVGRPCALQRGPTLSLEGERTLVAEPSDERTEGEWTPGSWGASSDLAGEALAATSATVAVRRKMVARMTLALGRLLSVLQPALLGGSSGGVEQAPTPNASAPTAIDVAHRALIRPRCARVAARRT